MNEIRRPPRNVDRDTRGIFWRAGSSLALPAHSLLWARVISLWARVQQSFPGRTVRRLRVRETLALGDKRQLLIVECGERQLLIGAAGNFLTMLTELPVAGSPKSGRPCE